MKEVTRALALATSELVTQLQDMRQNKFIDRAVEEAKMLSLERRLDDANEELAELRKGIGLIAALFRIERNSPKETLDDILDHLGTLTAPKEAAE